MSIDHKKIALIHIIKRELRLSDQEYRAILAKAAGVESAKDLDDQRFQRLMHYFVRSRYYTVNPRGLTIKQQLFIGHLQRELGWSPGHLSNFLKKYYRQLAVEKLSKAEAIKVIEALKNIKKHQLKPARRHPN